jgi:hypothetical protein
MKISRRMRWEKHVAYMAVTINANKILVGLYHAKRPL